MTDMINPELRDLKCEWLDVTHPSEFSPGIRLLRIQQTHGNDRKTEVFLTRLQAEQVAKVVAERKAH